MKARYRFIEAGEDIILNDPVVIGADGKAYLPKELSEQRKKQRELWEKEHKRIEKLIKKGRRPSPLRK